MVAFRNESWKLKRMRITVTTRRGHYGDTYRCPVAVIEE